MAYKSKSRKKRKTVFVMLDNDNEVSEVYDTSLSDAKKHVRYNDNISPYMLEDIDFVEAPIIREKFKMGKNEMAIIRKEQKEEESE